MIKTKSKYFYFFLLFFSLSPVFAASESSTFQVGASLISSCEFSITNLSFGNIAASSTGELKFNGNIQSKCNRDTSLIIKINGGNSGDFNNRKMFGTNGNLDVINYNIYIDETYTNPWQHTRGVAGLFNITGTGNIQNTIIYGKLNLNQYVKPDTYTDNLTITFEY